MIQKAYLLYLLPFFIIACSKPANNGIPSYLKIEDVTLTTTPGQGSSLHGISDLWIQSEGVNLGVSEYPRVLPALFSGERDVDMSAGIMQSGDFFTREIYPCYKLFNTTATFTDTDTTTINPSFTYRDEVQFVFIEDFETSNAFSGLNRTNATNSENIEGRAGFIQLNESTSSIQAKTGSTIAIPFGAKVFVEYHYKGSNDFGLGIESLNGGSVTSSSFFAFGAPSEEWRKIYIELTDIVIGLDAEEYNFFINASRLDTIGDYDLFIDNFKIVALQ